MKTITKEQALEILCDSMQSLVRLGVHDNAMLMGHAIDYFRDAHPAPAVDDEAVRLARTWVDIHNDPLVRRICRALLSLSETSGACREPTGQAALPPGVERLRLAVEPFVRLVLDSSGRIPHEKLSAAHWHELVKAAAEYDGPVSETSGAGDRVSIAGCSAMFNTTDGWRCECGPGAHPLKCPRAAAAPAIWDELAEIGKGMPNPAAPAAVDWIPVTERLPERFAQVLVACDELVPSGLLAWDGKRWCIGLSDYEYKFPITHWMPLPAPPNKAPSA